MKVLLHACCAPCGGQVIKELQEGGHKVIVYYYNPNVFPEDEYKLRMNEVERYTKEMGVKLIKGKYEHDEWLEFVKGLETEPEKGKRCEKCFQKRLGEAAQRASEEGCEAYTSTLTISPHKPAEMVNRIGQEFADFYGLQYIDTIWRKNDGYKKSCEICEKHDFHRQDYCGCEFSIRK
jgi:epoxyqueuosine reductase